MKTHALVFLALALTALAQAPNVPVPRARNISGMDQPAAGGTLPENYIVALTIEQKGEPALDMALVTASQSFRMDYFVGKYGASNFNGNLTVEDGGTLLLTYVMSSEIPVDAGNGGIQFKIQSVQSSVRLKPGEAVQILKGEPRSYRLLITKADAKK